MSHISFEPRWREELVASGGEASLVFELTMGSLHVYFPDKEKWQKSVPAWATDRWDEYHNACINWCKANRIPLSVVEDALVYEEK